MSGLLGALQEMRRYIETYRAQELSQARLDELHKKVQEAYLREVHLGCFDVPGPEATKREGYGNEHSGE